MALPSVPTHFNMVPGVPEDIGTYVKWQFGSDGLGMFCSLCFVQAQVF